jgi:2-oxoisovalerate dehydrogenase E1 component
VGAALEGLRPIVEIMWADFMLVGIDQLINQAANVRYVGRGKQSAPLVMRCQQGVTPGSCAQHSQSLEALLCHVPGLKVGLPATAQDAYAMLRAAVADPDPCILMEARALYGRSGPVDVQAPIEAVGGARLRRDGGDVAIVSWGRMIHTCLAAADALAQEGIEASVLDLRWLAPLDHAALQHAVEGCGRVVVVHEANETGGFGAEVAAWISCQCFDSLDAPVLRVGTPDVRMPSAPSLQAALVPDESRISHAVRGLVHEEA